MGKGNQRELSECFYVASDPEILPRQIRPNEEQLEMDNLLQFYLSQRMNRNKPQGAVRSF